MNRVTVGELLDRNRRPVKRGYQGNKDARKD